VLFNSLRVLRGTRFWIAPAAWVLGITALSGVALARLSWSFVDLYNLFYRATALSWRQTLGFAFAGGVEYRPLLIIGVKLAHQVVGLRAWFYKALVLLQFAAILGGLLWIFQPTTRRRAVAAVHRVDVRGGTAYVPGPVHVHSRSTRTPSAWCCCLAEF
jgi:hypothetical protein